MAQFGGLADRVNRYEVCDIEFKYEEDDISLKHREDDRELKYEKNIMQRRWYMTGEKR